MPTSFVLFVVVSPRIQEKKYNTKNQEGKEL